MLQGAKWAASSSASYSFDRHCKIIFLQDILEGAQSVSDRFNKAGNCQSSRAKLNPSTSVNMQTP